MDDNTLRYHLENDFFPARLKVINTKEICTVECLNKDCRNTWDVKRENLKTGQMTGGTLCQECEMGRPIKLSLAETLTR